jgi:outer membrane protein assembly factor BamA
VEGRSTRWNFFLGFREPFLDARRTSLDISLFQTDSVQVEVLSGVTNSRFELQQTGSSIEVGRPLNPQTVLSLRLRSVQSNITALPTVDPDLPCDPVTNPCNNPANFSEGRTVSLSLIGTRDARDSRTNPRHGSKQTLSLEFALPALGSDFAFQKYFAEWVQYVPVGSQSVIAGRISGGISTGNIPGQDQFALGGPTTLRGVPAAEFRGKSMALASLEFRQPLGGIAKFLENFTGVVFVDAGSTWGSDLSSNRFVVDYGIGVAFNSPLGTLRLDFAWGPSGTQTWLSLGHPF